MCQAEALQALANHLPVDVYAKVSRGADRAGWQGYTIGLWASWPGHNGFATDAEATTLRAHEHARPKRSWRTCVVVTRGQPDQEGKVGAHWRVVAPEGNAGYPVLYAEPDAVADDPDGTTAAAVARQWIDANVAFASDAVREIVVVIE